MTTPATFAPTARTTDPLFQVISVFDSYELRGKGRPFTLITGMAA